MVEVPKIEDKADSTARPAPARSQSARSAKRERALRDELFANFLSRLICLYCALPVIFAIPAVLAMRVFTPAHVAVWWMLTSIVALLSCAGLKPLVGDYDKGQGTPKGDRQVLLLIVLPSLLASTPMAWTFPSGEMSFDLVLILSVAGALTTNAGMGAPNLLCFAAAAAPPVTALAIGLINASDPYMAGFAIYFAMFVAFCVALSMSIRNDRRKQIENSFHLAESLEATRAANTAKSQFIAAMSHELRTPLNAIMGFSEVIATQTLGPVGSVKYLEYAKDIHFSGSHLLNLINDVLDLAKIESGKIEIVRRELDPQVLIRATTRMIAPRARERDVTLRTAIEAHDVTFYADERAATQILLNVVTNAVKFNKPGGEVTIQCKCAPEGGVLFVVKDTGPGIPEDQIERLFEPFEQGENNFNRGKGGTGLGLAIVRSLMKMHGGAVWLESQLGRGTDVFIHFPAHCDQEAVDLRDRRRSMRTRA